MPSNGTSWFKRQSLVILFILAYAVTWSIQIPLALSMRGSIDTQTSVVILHYLGAFGPLIAAVIVIALTEDKAGIRALTSRRFKWRVELRYYVFAVLAPFAFFILAVLINRVFSGEWSDLALHLEKLERHNYVQKISHTNHQHGGYFITQFLCHKGCTNRASSTSSADILRAISTG